MQLRPELIGNVKTESEAKGKVLSLSSPFDLLADHDHRPVGLQVRLSVLYHSVDICSHIELEH